MTPSQKKAVERHRQRQLERGIVRMEISIPEEDKDLMRSTAALLREDGAGGTQVRLALQSILMGNELVDFKRFLEMAPLEGVDLERVQDYGRDIEL